MAPDALVPIGSELVARHAMGPVPGVVSSALKVQEASRFMREHSLEEVLVRRPGTGGPHEFGGLAFEDLVGIVTESDALAFLAEGRNSRDAQVSELMSSPVRVASPGDTLEDVLSLFRAWRLHRLPIVEYGRVIGMLSRDTVLEAQNNRLRALQDQHVALVEEAFRDALTGLFNRRSLERTLGTEVTRQPGMHDPLGLLLVDVDHFKAINDTFGHQRGDLVLRELANRLSASTRRTDFVARFGGEEFAVLVRVSQKRDLFLLAEKLRAVVAGAPFGARAERRHSDIEALSSIQPQRLQSQPPLSLSISVGVAAFEAPLVTAGDLVRAADSALYRAKAAGRDCTRSWDPEEATWRPPPLESAIGGLALQREPLLEDVAGSL